jgi:hypothetical protein
MRFNRVKKLLLGAFAAILLFGAAPLTANAQSVVVRPRVFVVHRPFFNPWWGSPYYYTYTDPIAYQRETGYSDGLSRGKSDAKHGKAFDPDSHSHLRNSDSATYRDAFVQGYNDGYRRS